MRRWHLTLLLLLLASMGIALASGLPALVVIGTSAVSRIAEPTPLVQPTTLVQPTIADPIVQPMHTRSPDRHPVRVPELDKPSAQAIPELGEPLPSPRVVLPADPEPPGIPDGCPMCGMG